MRRCATHNQKQIKDIVMILNSHVFNLLLILGDNDRARWSSSIIYYHYWVHILFYKRFIMPKKPWLMSKWITDQVKTEYKHESISKTKITKCSHAHTVPAPGIPKQINNAPHQIMSKFTMRGQHPKPWSCRANPHYPEAEQIRAGSKLPTQSKIPQWHGPHKQIPAAKKTRKF